MSFENPLVTTVQHVNFPVDQELTSRNVFYATYPTYLRPFAQYWVRKWLQWYDGKVEGIHDNTGNMISTRLASTLCSKVAQQIFGGGLLFSKKGDGKTSTEENAIKFISGDYNDDIALDENVAQAILLAVAGGTSFIVENFNSFS